MTQTMLIAALLAATSLVACDKPTVINVPATPIAVPGPAGPQGATGNQGNDGSKGATGGQGATGNQGNDGNTGATGKAGDGTTVIVMQPAASAPTN
jgi:hypothetical protein